MQTRQLTAIDAPSYHELRLRMLREHADAFTSSFEEDSRKPLAWIEKRIGPGEDSPHDFVLGAFAESGDLIGIVGLAVEARAKQRHKGVLFGMYVAAEASAGGVGRALLSHCLDRARAIPGLEQINLTVTATNERARRFYEAAGFRVFGVEERAIKVGGAYSTIRRHTWSCILIVLRSRRLDFACEHDRKNAALCCDCETKAGSVTMPSPSMHAVEPVKQISLAEALSRLPESSTTRSIELFRHGTLLVKWYAPRDTDLQQPHTRDEVYFVGRGSGDFVHADSRIRFVPGDFLFAAAGVAHRFENFSSDLGVWVLFYGPEGGEAS